MSVTGKGVHHAQPDPQSAGQFHPGECLPRYRENITSLQLAPGTTVSTQELAAKLQVSRTPVREAFIRLQKEDLVEITPQKGTMVSRIDLTRAEKGAVHPGELKLPFCRCFCRTALSRT